MIYYGLLLFFLLEYVRPGSYVPGLMALRLNSIVPLANFTGAVLTGGQRAWSSIAVERNTWFIVTLLLLVSLSMMTADVTMYAYQGLTTLLGYAMAYWVMMSELTTERRVVGVFKMLVAVHVIVAYLNPVLFTDPGNRHYLTSGFFLGDGNDFALSLNVVIPLCLGLLLGARGIVRKGFWAAALLVLVAAVVLTQSRGGTLALAAMGAYYWAKSEKKVQTGLVAVTVVALILLYAPAAYFQRMGQLTDTQEGSASARIGAWKASVRMAADHPLLGVGAGHFGVKYGAEYRTADVYGSGMTAHSLYFLALGELGLPGFGAVLWFFIYNLRANRHLAGQVRERGGPNQEADLRLLSSTSASLIGFAAGAAFLSCLYYPHIYVLCGLMGATRGLVRRRLDVVSGEVQQPVARPVACHPATQNLLARSATVRNSR